MSKFFFIFWAFLSFTTVAHAEIYTGAVSASAGGTGRASVDAGVSSFLNPAMIVHQKGRQVYTGWTKDEMLVSLTENSEDAALPSSLGFWQKQNENSIKQQDFRVSFAEFVRGIWALGITGHYYQVVGSEKTYSQGLIDIGLAVTPVPDVGLALVFYNLGGSKLDELSPELRINKKVGVAFNHIYQNFLRTRIDLVSGEDQEWRKSTLMLGLETYINKWVVSRLGYQNNSYLKEDLMSLGLGFDLPKFRLNYAYIYNSTNSKDQRHAVDITIPF